MPEFVGRLWRRAVVLLRWRQHQAELREEMEAHRELKASEFEAQGMSPADAKAAAARAMGPMTSERESARNVWALRWADDLHRDVSYALRSMWRAPVFTGVAVLGLAGGLGFSIAAFTAFNAIVVRGWPMPESDRLTALYAVPQGSNRELRSSGFSYREVEALQASAKSLRQVFVWERSRTDETGGPSVAFVSAGYFSALQTPLALGREFTPDEDRIAASARVIVLTDRWWRERLLSDPAVLGKAVRVSGVPFTVVGVLAPGFSGADPRPVDAWVPMSALSVLRPRERMARGPIADATLCCVQIGARLADGYTRDDAVTDVTAVLARLRNPLTDTVPRIVSAERFTLIGTSGPRGIEDITPFFALLFVGVALVLLLACANVANLLLARAAVREREIGIRLSLGASRSRLVRQLMTEGLSLALLALPPAMLLAALLPPWIIASFGVTDVAFDFSMDLRVVAVSIALAVASCVLFGLVPALQASRRRVAVARVPLRAVFLSTQVALCTVLLVCAGLFFRSVRAGMDLELGYDPSGVQELTMVPPANEDPAKVAPALTAELSAAMRTLGVRDWALAEQPLFAFATSRVWLRGEEARMNSMAVSADYFSLLKMRLLSGRAYTDGALAAGEVMVNAYLAQEFGGVTAALGKTIVVDSLPRTIVGVVANARDAGSIRDTMRTLYRPPTGRSAPRLLLATTPAEAQRVAQLLRDRDPALGIGVRPYEWYVERVFGPQRGAATIAAALGALALLLAAVGMFGVFAYWVEQRRREIGIRVALGASRASVLSLLLLATGRAVGWGLVFGVVLATLAAQVLRGSLYGLAPLDPAAFGLALTVLLSSALVATLWPAWSAVRVTPLEAIRSD